VRVLIVVAVLLTPFVLGAGWFAYQLRPGSDGPKVILNVREGCGTSCVADLLAKRDVIGSTLAFKLWSAVTGAGPFQTGRYELHEGMGIRSSISALEAGPPQKPDVKLFLPPGLTLPQIAERVGKLPGLDADKFLEVVGAGTIRSKYQPPEVTSLEGLLFPDTYLIGASWDEEQVVQLLVDQFDTIADKVALGNAQGITPYQVAVIASLIQTETRLAEDAPMISAVIRNRIAKGMKLQIDYTLCYARQQTTGTGCPPPPTDGDKQINSPYNTYIVAGLPPTPIASFTEASLKAALTPANVPYLYYVIADAKGKHAFATTLEEHERNVQAARAKGLL
jgi:peptidoglycan lytic transglycosylase G